MNRPMHINEICALFEIDPRTVPNMNITGPLPEIEANLEKFKEVFKAAYRNVAMKYHPDHGANEKQVERFKLITQVYKELQKIKVKKIPVRRPMQTVVIRTGGWQNTSGSTTSGSWGGGSWYWSSGGGGHGSDGTGGF